MLWEMNGGQKLADVNLSSIPTDYVVDRVYSCVGSGGNMMVIEGHRG